jgi:hypothetical protein
VIPTLPGWSDMEYRPIFLLLDVLRFLPPR